MKNQDAKCISENEITQKNNEEVDMNKSAFYGLIGQRLNDAIKRLHTSQAVILEECQKKRYKISQSALSKLLNGSGGSVHMIAQVCNILHLDISEVLSFDNCVTELSIESNNEQKNDEFISNANNSVFRAYLGEYNAYFFTTKSEDHIHSGKFTIGKDPKTHNCIANFKIEIKEEKEDEKKYIKEYTGPIYFSEKMQAIYCELTSFELVEKSYILFHYDHINFQQLECRLATAITISSGLKRNPAMHKILLTRKELSEKDLAYLSGQLKLNNSEIYISENAYHEFLRDELVPKSFFDYFGEKDKDASRFISSVANMSFYAFNESLISDSFLPKEDKAQIICLLRKYSAAPRYNKISEKADEIIYKYLKKEEEKTKAIANDDN